MDDSLLRIMVLAFAILILGGSLYGILAPKRLAAKVSSVWARPWSMPMAVGVRLVMGAILVASAPLSRYPLVFHVIGWAALIAALLLPLAGKQRVGKIIDWSAHLSPMAMRAWCLVGVAMGLVLAYGVA